MERPLVTILTRALTSLGSVARATGSNSIAIGNRATASGTKSIMISNDGIAVTNNVANSLALSFDQSGHVFFTGLTAPSYFNGSGNFGFGTKDPEAKLHVNGSTRLDGPTTQNGDLEVNGGILSTKLNITETMTLQPSATIPTNPKIGEMFLYDEGASNYTLKIWLGGTDATNINNWKTVSVD